MLVGYEGPGLFYLCLHGEELWVCGGD